MKAKRVAIRLYILLHRRYYRFMADSFYIAVYYVYLLTTEKQTL